MPGPADFILDLTDQLRYGMDARTKEGITTSGGVPGFEDAGFRENPFEARRATSTALGTERFGPALPQGFQVLRELLQGAFGKGKDFDPRSEEGAGKEELLAGIQGGKMGLEKTLPGADGRGTGILGHVVRNFPGIAAQNYLTEKALNSGLLERIVNSAFSDEQR